MLKSTVYTLIAITIFCGCGDVQQQSSDEEANASQDSVLTVADLDLKLMGGDSSAQVFFNRAQLQFEQGDLKSAASDIISAIRKDSSRVEYFYLLSDIQLNAYQSRRALESLKKAVSLDRDNRTSLLKLMELQILLKQYIPAINTSQTLLQLDPQDYQVFFLRGLLFKENNEDSLAIVNLQRTVDLNPEMTDAFIMLGDLHEKQSNPLSEGYYRNAVQSDPENLNALHAYGFYLQNHDQIDEALEIYDRMMALEASGPAPYVNSAVLLMTRDSFEYAKELLIKAQAMDTSFAVTPYFLGNCLVELGDIEGAKKAYRRALELDSQYLDAQKALKNL